MPHVCRAAYVFIAFFLSEQEEEEDIGTAVNRIQVLAAHYLFVLVNIEASKHLNGEVFVYLRFYFTQVAISVHFCNVHVSSATAAEDVLSLHT